MNPNMTPIDWAKRPLQKYADFSGRAPRAEYWWFYLFVMLGYVAASIIDSMVGLGGTVSPYGILTMLFGLAMLVPSLAAGARRLHDIGRSGWWLLIVLVPIIGIIVLIVFLVTPSEPGDNQYGPNPYGEGGGRPVPAE
jgi:uncharacterized membrane protein YhaH (DUF805 family)